MKYSSTSWERVSGLETASIVVGPPRLWFARADLPEHGHALTNERLVDLVHVERLADAAQQRDGEPAAQVLAELVQSGKDAGAALAAVEVARQLGHEQLEADRPQQLDHPLPLVRGQVAAEAGVRGVQRDA